MKKLFGYIPPPHFKSFAYPVYEEKNKYFFHKLNEYNSHILYFYEANISEDAIKVLHKQIEMSDSELNNSIFIYIHTEDVRIVGDWNDIEFKLENFVKENGSNVENYCFYNLIKIINKYKNIIQLKSNFIEEKKVNEQYFNKIINTISDSKNIRPDLIVKYREYI